jgi:hypothetical protein
MANLLVISCAQVHQGAQPGEKVVLRGKGWLSFCGVQISPAAILTTGESDAS